MQKCDPRIYASLFLYSALRRWQSIPPHWQQDQKKAAFPRRLALLLALPECLSLAILLAASWLALSKRLHHLPPLASSAYPNTATSNQRRRIRAVVPLPRGPRVPSLPLVGLCQLRVQQHQKAIEGCGVAAAMATENPRVLNAIPEQNTLLLPCLCLGPCKR